MKWITQRLSLGSALCIGNREALAMVLETALWAIVWQVDGNLYKGQRE
nr:hypothetical protein [Nitrosomonas sp. PY1]